MAAKKVYRSSFTHPLGVRCYPLLKSPAEGGFPGLALMEKYPRETLMKMFTVSLVDKDDERWFFAFNNFYEYLNILPRMFSEENMCMFEVIFGEKRQKMYFDIDFPSVTSPELGEIKEKDATDFVGRVIAALIAEVKSLNFNVEDKDILLYSSSKYPKYSYHLLLDNFVFPDAKHCKEMFKRVSLRLKGDKYLSCLDASMYKSIQQFRLLGCCKYGTGRYKKQIPYNGYVHEEGERELFRRSIVGYTSYISHIIIFDIEEKKLFRNPAEGTVILNEEEVKEAFKLYREKAGDNHSLLQVVDGMILMKRNKPSMCAVCGRIHEHENGFLAVAPDSAVFFSCRRNKRSQMLGYLPSTPYVDKPLIKAETEVKVDKPLLKVEYKDNTPAKAGVTPKQLLSEKKIPPLRERVEKKDITPIKKIVTSIEGMGLN